MRLALYAESANGVGGRLQQLIETLVPRKRVEVYRTTDALLNRFRQPRDGLQVAVIMCERREELVCLNAMAHLLSDIRIVLLFLDKSGIKIGEGHTLYPRFATYVSNGSELVDVAAVLKRIVHGSKSKTI